MAASSLHRAFGRVVRRRREAAGYSQEGLADEAEVHRTYVSMLERGQANPSLSVIAALAAALDTSVTSLFREAEGGSS